MMTFQVAVQVGATLSSLGPEAEVTNFNGRFKPLMFCIEVDVPIIVQHSPLDFLPPRKL
jgi:hypothetical protein